VSEATWWRHLAGDPSRFLLDDAEPGVVWRTLIDLLGRPHDSPAAQRARLAGRSVGAAAALLAHQSPHGFWGSPSAYGAHWGGSAWQLIAAASLGADPEDPRASRGVETLLTVLEPRSAGFAPARGKMPAACFTAELCTALARFGYAHHPRVREALAWLAERDRGLGGWSCPELRHLVEGGCVPAAVATLRLVAELAPAERRPLQPLADRAERWLLDHGLFLDGPAPRGWYSFAHPVLSRTDLVDALAALALLRRPLVPPLAAALAVVLARQEADGRWVQRAAVPFGEPRGEPSRWVTLKALLAVAAWGERLPVAGPA
jgi:hypothetical protein